MNVSILNRCNIMFFLNTPRDIYLTAQCQNLLNKKNVNYNMDYYSCDMENNWTQGPQHNNFLQIIENIFHKRDLLSRCNWNSEEYLNKMMDVVHQIGEYDVYCFSLWDAYVDIQLLMALEIRKKYPKSRILFGGPDIILRPQLGMILKKLGFDYSTGDADESLVNYIIDYDNFYTTRHIKKMNGLTIDDVPKYTNDELKFLDHTILLSSSRGCPHSCYFCSSPALCSYSFVERKTLVEWFKYYNDIGVKRIRPNDSTFNFYKFDELLDGLISIDNKIPISGADVSFRDLKMEHLSKMQKVGFLDVAFGLECLHPTLQKNINKKMPDVNKILEFLDEFQKYGIQVKMFYIAGMPTQTDDIFYEEAKVIEYIDKTYNNVHLEIYDYFVSPKSYIHKNPDNFGIKSLNFFDNFKYSLPMFSKEINMFETGKVPNTKVDEYMKHLHTIINNRVDMKGDDRYA